MDVGFFPRNLCMVASEGLAPVPGHPGYAMGRIDNYALPPLDALSAEVLGHYVVVNPESFGAILSPETFAQQYGGRAC